MMTRRSLHHVLLLTLCLAVVAFAMPSFADPAVTAADCKAFAGLTNRVAGCIRITVNNSVTVYFTQFYPMLQRAIEITMTLAVVLYGILLAFGMVEKLGRDTMMLAIRLALVMYFCANSPLIWTTVTQAMDSAAVAVVTYVPQTGTATGAASGTSDQDTDFSQNKCLQNAVTQQENAPQGQPVSGPWLGIDCLLDTVIGIKSDLGNSDSNPNVTWYNPALDASDASKSNAGPARGLIFFLFSNAKTSILGVLMAVIGAVFLYGLVMVVVKSLFTYLAGYMGIAFLVVISPLIIPCVLFTNTREYFNKWVKLMISFALQPIIMLVFIIFSLAAMDFAVFSGTYSVMYRIAGDASRQPNFDLNSYLNLTYRNPDGTPAATPPVATAKTIISQKARVIAQTKATPDTPVALQGNEAGGVMSNLAKSKCVKELMDLDPNLKKNCSYQYPITVMGDNIDWKLLALARTPAVVVTPEAEQAAAANGSASYTEEDLKAQEIAREVISSLLFAGVVVFILNGLLAVVPMVANDLVGDFNVTPSLVFSGAVPGMSNGKAGRDIASSLSQSANRFAQQAKSLAEKR